MTTKRYEPDHPGRYSPDEAAKLFVHHLALALSFWEIGCDETHAIDLAARNLPHDSYRRTLYALIPILDHIYKED
jgi:hypothetical protein